MNETTYTCQIPSPIGMLTAASDGGSIIGLWFEGQKYYAATLGDKTEEKPDLEVFAALRSWLDDYFAGKKPKINFMIEPKGSDFRQAVWKILLDIPYGKVITYGEIARKLSARSGGKVCSAQAVGGAVGHNPISLVIPCHRVVGTNGSLTGYAGGVDKKIDILKLEGTDMDKLFVPKKSSAL